MAQPPLSGATSLSVDRTDSRVLRSVRSCSPSSSSSSSSLRVFLSKQLFVGDLEPDVTESDLTNLFGEHAKHGKLESVRVIVNPRRSLAYAYVVYRSEEDAATAMLILNSTLLNNKPIRIRHPNIRISGAANIFIKNLDTSLDDKALQETFSVFGTIFSCSIATDGSGKSKGYGFVQFDREEAAQNAIDNLNGMLINDKQIYVGPFLRKQERDMSTNKTKFNNVYVKNFSESTTEEDLKMVFGKYGTITSVVVMRDGDGKSKCFGLVNFEAAYDAAQAVEDLNGKKFDDKKWYVGKAPKKSEGELKGRFYQSMKEAVDKVQGVNLILKNLDDSIGDDKLRELFSEFGTITSCKVMRDPGGISRGSGFVAFSTFEEASRALSEMNRKIVVIKPLYVALAQHEEDRKARLQVNEGNTANCSKELLFNQTNYISEGIRQGEEFGRMRCILTNPDKDIWALTETQKEYVRQTGLHHLAGIDRMVIDHALITALIEWWCPETNSFHLPSGEATITLEDVAYIYGLQVDGPLVTGRTFPSRFVEPVCQELLGITPQKKQDYIGITINFKWLEDNFKPSAWLNKKKKKSKDDEIRATRAYLFFLVAGQIFTQTSGARGPAYLLELFREFKPYAWAPACLANLYRMLANATWWGHGTKEAEGKGKDQQKSCRTPTGPFQLLQIWAYSRMSIGRCPLPDPSWKKDIQFPLFKTWHRRLGDHPPLATVKEVRDQLNSLPADGFTWRPYSDYGKKFRMNVPKGDRDLFSSSTVLVWYWIVERHYTWRVMKQFGLKQLVPPPFNVLYVRRERIERVLIDYSSYMDEEIAALWAVRSQLRLLGEKCNQPGHSEEYFVWYFANVVRHIGRVEHRESNEAEAPAQQADPFVLEKYVDELVARLEQSCDRAERRKKSNSSLAVSIRKKLKTFKAAFGMRFENFSMEQADSSQSNEDVEKIRSGPTSTVPPQTVPDTDAGPCDTVPSCTVQDTDVGPSHIVPRRMDPETAAGPSHTAPLPHTRVKKAALKSPKANT